ncbi:MAG: ABC transporter ATP-binding protein [Acidimicrobiia bacterium]|nr:ABC transporter ATP-binding protein [Acidimicrobiia bacterium]
MTASAQTPTSTVAARSVGVSKIYGVGGAEVRALDDVDVEFEAGRFTAIMGPSGSGKSTLLHVSAGLDHVSSGNVYIGDVDLGSLSDRDLTLLRRKKVGFIFQAFNLIPTLTAEENIILPISIAGEKPDTAFFDQVVGAVGLGDRLKHLPSELSGGQQQRVAAARALVSRPDIVFADEPSGNLDSKSGAELLSFMRTAVKELGQTIVMVTHDPSAAAYSDRTVFLQDGKVIDELHDPSAEDILNKMKILGG